MSHSQSLWQDKRDLEDGKAVVNVPGYHSYYNRTWLFLSHAEHLLLPTLLCVDCVEGRTALPHTYLESND